MYRLRSLRTLAVATAAAALIAPAVVALSSPAQAGSVKRHDVNIYKVEGFVELGGEYPDNEAHEHLYCEDGDYAIDGMWKVDSYETPNADDGVYGDKRSVRTTESWPDGTLEEKWHYYFVNDGTGRATIKTFIVCVTPETGMRAGHSHDIDIDRYDTGLPLVTVADDTETSPFGGCPVGYVAVAPGFKVAAGAPQLVASYPSADGRDWRWKFKGSGDITFYLSCLKSRVSNEVGTGDDPAKPHTHDLDLAWMPSAPAGTSLDVGTDQTLTRSAAWRDFAAVGAFWIDAPTTVSYLGMDARGRKRDFKFWNAGASASNVYTAILSLHKRTSPQLKP